jgi:hypothetical protein
VALGADYVQATGFAHLLIVLLHHGVVFSLHLGDAVAQGLDLGVFAGGLFGRLGDAVFQLQQGELSVAPGIHKVFGESGQLLLAGFGETAGIEAPQTAGLARSFG